MTEDTSVQDMMNSFNDKFKMLGLVNSSMYKTHAEEIAEYIGGSVK